MTITCAAPKPFSYTRTDARKHHSTRHGVCSNKRWRSTRTTHAPLRCCPRLTSAYLEPFDGDYLSPAALDRALELAETAVRLDASLPQARAQLGEVLVWKRQHDAAIAEFERAFALNPNFIDYRYARAFIYAGEPARAIKVLEANVRLDPFQPLAYSLGFGGLANYMLKR